MLPWTRPPPHPTFAGAAAQLLDALRIDLGSGSPHEDHFKKRSIWNGSWTGPQQPRGVHKHSLLGDTPWTAKCSWCEQLRSGRRELDVEHYRPKVWITQWDGDPPYVSDEPPKEIDVGPGYWWLAFDWRNYSLACKPCNQGWKRNLFPMLHREGTCIEGVEQRELPLLLDPASDFRPRDHFRWTVDGIIEPVSHEGRATIITMGLNRRELLVRREKVARDTEHALTRLRRALRDGDGRIRQEALGELARLGSRSAEFTSMVRWLVEDGLDCEWDQLDGMPP